MSVTIKSRNEDVSFMPNSCGWQLYGLVNKYAGCPIYYEDMDCQCARPLDNMTAEQAEAAGNRIKYKYLRSNKASNRLEGLAIEAMGLYIGDLAKIIHEYATWLEKCGGYELCD